MEKFRKIIGLNLLILFAYSVISKLLGNLGGDLTILTMMAVFIVVQIVICFIIGIKKVTESKKQEGAIYLLTCFLVLIIGFGTCYKLGSVTNSVISPQVEEKIIQ